MANMNQEFFPCLQSVSLSCDHIGAIPTFLSVFFFSFMNVRLDFNGGRNLRTECFYSRTFFLFVLELEYKQQQQYAR